MFGLFKKRRPVVFDPLSAAHISFLNAVAKALSAQYPRFNQQIELNVIEGITVDPMGGTGSYLFVINADEWKALCDPGIPNFDLRNVRCKDANSRSCAVRLYVSEGLLLGYHCDVPLETILPDTVDVSCMFEEYGMNGDLESIQPFIKDIEKSQLKRLNLLSSAYHLRVEGHDFVIVHDEGEGNLIGVSPAGEVYSLAHDPFQVQKVDNSLAGWLSRKRFDKA